jgi:hypothetical protein
MLEPTHNVRSVELMNRFMPKWEFHRQVLNRLRAFAERISPDDRDFKHLHPAQLVKHVLGLKRQFGRDGFRLLYLWYDVLGKEGTKHREEVEEFAAVAEQDQIRFQSVTYQELIAKMDRLFRAEHPAYVRYLTERYL